jgi:hypothetical protein
MVPILFNLGCVSDGWSYEGDWRDGKRNGHGTKTWSEGGGRLEAEFRDDEANGYGVFDGAGDHYEGEFRDDLPNGHGSAILRDGRRYEGEWRDGLPHGPGILVDKQKIFRGTWTNGCLKDGNKWVAIDRNPTSCP